MNQAQFLIEHKAAITTIKKRAFKKAVWVFAGVTALLISLVGSAFWILLLFPVVAAFITYARLSQSYLHRQFPDYFGPPETPEPRNPRIFDTLHPFNPASPNFWDRWWQR